MTPPSRIYNTTTHSPMSKIIHAAFLLTWATESPKYTAHAFLHPSRVTFPAYPAFGSSTNKAHSFQRRLSTQGNLQLERNDTAFRDVIESTTTFAPAVNADLDVSVASSSRYNKRMMTPYSSIIGGEASAADNTSPVPTDVSSFTTPSRNQPSPTSSSWKDRLVDISNIASFLCILDCTLLPLLSIALPIVSWITTATGIVTDAPAVTGMASLLATHLPYLAHTMALFFVVPVGLLTALVNHVFGHRQIKYTAAALFGLCLIYTTNSHVGMGMESVVFASSSPPVHAATHVHDACGAVVGAATGMLTHTCGSGIGEGWVHRLMNTMGCGFLFGSNYYGKKYMERRSRGCAASVLVEAWGNVSEEEDVDGERRLVCLPGCGCEVPSYGKGARVGSPEEVGGEMFFSWDGTAGDMRGRAGRSGDSSGRKRFTRFRQ